jgi:uncharacterized protein (TIGR02996 family)
MYSQTSHDPFHARVLADPHDADLRIVWADALQERGDPRGELIALQLQPPPLTPAQDKRLRSLIAKHRVEWLGDLDPIVQRREGLVFDRGVLAECQIQVKNVPAFARAIGNPLWATVRRIWFCDKFAWDPRIVPLLVHDVFRELRQVVCVGLNNVLPALARNKRPLPITSIWTDDDRFRDPVDSFASLTAAPGLPALARLGFTIDEDERDAVLAHPLVRTISTLGITSHTTSASWLEPTRTLANLTTLEMRNWWIPVQGPQRPHVLMRFTRGSRGRWTRLYVEPVGHIGELLQEETEALAGEPLEEITVPANLARYFTRFKKAKLVRIAA